MDASSRLFAPALVLLAAATAAGQEVPPVPVAEGRVQAPANTVTLGPSGLLFGIGVEYERAVSRQASVFGGPSLQSVPFTREEISTLGFSLGLRYFPGGDAPRGFFLGPVAGLFDTTARDPRTGLEASGLGYQAGVVLGHTWLLQDAFDVSIGLGAQYVAVEVEQGGTTMGYAGPLPIARIALGVAF